MYIIIYREELINSMNTKKIKLLSLLPIVLLAGCGPSKNPNSPSSEPGVSNTDESSEQGVSHAIALDNSVANGTVRFSVAEASKGDVVTVTATPDQGFALSKFTSTSADVAFTSTGELTATFVMPDHEVVIGAEFNAIDGVQIGSFVNLSPDRLIVEEQTLKQNSVFPRGQKLEFKVRMSQSIWDIADRLKAVIGSKFGTVSEDPDDSYSSIVSFDSVQEGGDVFFYLSSNTPVSDQSQGYQVSLAPAEGVHFFDVDSTARYSSSVKILGYTDPGYVVDEISFAGTKVSLNYSQYDSSVFSGEVNLSKDVEVSTVSRNVGYHTITYINQDKVRYTNPNPVREETNTLPTFGNVGTTIDLHRSLLTAATNISGGFYLKAITLPDGLQNVLNDGKELKFTMPDKDVQIAFEIGDKITIKVKLSICLQPIFLAGFQPTNAKTSSQPLPVRSFTFSQM